MEGAIKAWRLRIPVGGAYRHIRTQNPYFVVGHALNVATQEIQIVYAEIKESDRIHFVRNATDFIVRFEPLTVKKQ